jgi:CHAT domain-containing protein
LPEGGAIVAPLITKVGGKVLLVTRSKDSPNLSVIDLPDLTTSGMNEIMNGHADDSKTIGWLGAYKLQDQLTHYSEWIAAIETIGPDLWRLFAGALANELAARGVRHGARLIMLPTGALGLLPLGLAQDPDTGGRLIDSYEMVEAPSLEALAVAGRRISTTPTRTLVAVVNPTGLIPRLALPFTETEGTLIETHFKPTATVVLDKSNATPEAVVAALKGKDYWHFSSHGFFDWKDARASGLLMKDGQRLTVGRLLERQGALGRPRLVVLSACETGLYDTNRNPEEFVGLPATFVELGAAGVVGSLWQVDDAATALLMAKFYDLHLDEGLSPPAALRAAQIWLRASTRADLIAYGEAAAQSGHLTPEQSAELQGRLRSGPRAAEGADSRFALSWNIIQNRTGEANNAGTHDPSSQPFAHPLYWGAFIYTGL